MDEKTDGGESSWVFEILLAAVVLYFAWRAGPMLNYYSNLNIGERMWEDADGFFESAFALTLLFNDEALIFLTAGVPLIVFLTRVNSSSNAGIGLAFLSLGPLGWYIGREFSAAFARKAACQSQSFLGFGCTLDGEPMLSFMLFSVVVVIAAIFVALALLARFFG
ncbi:hypothetical protein HW571_28640 [Agrobacterium genomosp. 3]|uniref:hypothetical protein n=1 Tax=Agrobacterium tomkonis TaxID=1183410 RepID=UPI001CD8420E|nr:hypothetical protein [Agrobacterium tomkonis]MCA1879915.1 hypothetical protein [Agrobacterium tumefaciens]MCA1895165.1 hypothetical protein [Agrobacterium tomkonis]